MWSMGVVELLVLVQGMDEMSLVPDQRPVEQLQAAAANRPLHDRIHAGDLNTAEDHRDTGVGENSIEQGGELAVPVADRYVVLVPASSRSMARFLAACVTQAPVGCAVAPRIRIRRLACSMAARM